MKQTLVFLVALSIWSQERATTVWRGQTVEYRIVDGRRLVDGDVEIEPDDSATKAAGRESVYRIEDRFRWPGALVPFSIDPELPRPERVREAITEWETHTPFRFVEQTNEPDFVRFRNVPSGCSANLGRIGGQQFVSLAPNCSLGNTIHEIGHAVGLYHTQARLDRHRNIRVRFDNIAKQYWSQYIQQLQVGADFGPYDYDSIMHYSPSGFQKDAGVTFETTPPGIANGQRGRLSSGDKLVGRFLAGDAPGVYIVDTAPSGLEITVDGTKHTTPAEFAWAPGESHEVTVPELAGTQPDPSRRLRFARWSDGGERSHAIQTTSQRLILAYYAEEFRVRQVAANEGRIVADPPSADGFYPRGTRLTLKALPPEGFQFFDWAPGAGGVTVQVINRQGSSSNPTTFTVDRSNLFYTARFTQNPFHAITSNQPGAFVTVDGIDMYLPRHVAWAAGSAHTLIARRSTVWGEDANELRFLRWNLSEDLRLEINATPENREIRVELDRYHSILPGLEWQGTAGVNPSIDRNLELAPAPERRGSNQIYKAGQEVIARATPPDGMRLALWSGDTTGSEPERRLLIDDQLQFRPFFTIPTVFSSRGVLHAASRQPVVAVSPGLRLWIVAPGLKSGDQVQVSFGSTTAVAETVEADRALVVVPADLDLTLLRIAVTLRVNGAQRGGVLTIPLLDANPGIETQDDSGLGTAKARNEDDSANSESAPAAAGSLLRFTYAGAPPATARVEVWIGERACEVVQASEREVTVRVPAVLNGGRLPLSLALNGVPSQVGVFVFVQASQ